MKGAVEEEEPEGGRKGKRERTGERLRSNKGVWDQSKVPRYSRKKSKMSSHTGKCLPVLFTLFQNQLTMDFHPLWYIVVIG